MGVDMKTDYIKINVKCEHEDTIFNEDGSATFIFGFNITNDKYKVTCDEKDGKWVMREEGL